MSLTVLNVGYPLATVSPDASGGAEQVLSMMDEALVRSGYRSFVLAPEGSRCCGTLISTPAYNGVLDEATQRESSWQCKQAVARTLDRLNVDVVHLHGIDFFNYLPETCVPAVVTLHLPPSWYPPEIFRLTRPNTHLVCVSYSQRQACPASARISAVIENGIAVEKFGPAASKKNYVAALGRICPEKGFHFALDAASLSVIPLYLAGSVYEYPAHREYFEREIRPRLKSHGHRFLGPVGGRKKSRLLAEARALLVPSLAPETSSLVAMEAMACGTPVIAFRAGALSEIVTDGHTGFLVDSVEQMAEAILRAGECNPAECRKEAVQRFSSGRMCADYLELYKSVTALQIPEAEVQARVRCEVQG